MMNGQHTITLLTLHRCDGNGFKLGGSGVGTPHVVINCLAIENLYHGFTDNNNPAEIGLKNVTAFDNNQGGKKNNFSLYRCKDAYVANAVSYTTSGTSDKYVNLSAEYTVLYNSSKWYKVEELQAMDTGKSAARGTVLSSGITSSDFIVSTVPAVGTDFHKVWRNADGTINTNGVAIISSDSDYAKFSTDGGIIGARFFSNNKAIVKEVEIDSSVIKIPKEDVEMPTERVEKPDASLASGTYNSSQYVEFSTVTEGATIYYTTNGEEPTISSTKYTDGIIVSETTTVKAMAVKSGMNDSSIVVFEYIINNPSVIDVIVSPLRTSVQKGSSQQFTAELVVENDADQSVIWTVTGGNDSTITQNGLLEVGTEEMAENLTVTATSAFDDTKKGTAEVVVTEIPIIYHTVTVKAVPDEGGVVSGGGEVAVGGYSNMYAKANDGYMFREWTENDSHYTTAASISVYIESDRSFTAVFEPIILDEIRIAVEPTTTTYMDGEKFNPEGMIVIATYRDGTTSAITDYTYTPSGALTASDRKVTISYGGKTADVAITVNEVVETYKIIASAGVGGTISPQGDVNVKKGSDKTFTITQNSGYYISDVIVDMKSIGATNQYTFSDVIENHTIRAIFKQYIDDDSSDSGSSGKDNDNTESTQPATAPTTTPTQQVISVEEISKNVETAIASGKALSISIPKNSGMFEISKEASTKLKNASRGLEIRGLNTQISLASDVFNQLSGTTLSVSVSNLLTESHDKIKALVGQEDNITLIGDAKLTTDLTLKADGKKVEKLEEPLAIVIDLSGELKQIKDTSKLTVARVTEINGKIEITKIGGEYDSETKTFKAYSDQIGKYILLECDNIKKINLVIDSNISTINGIAKANDIAPVVINDRTMVPLRFITENLGGTVKWNEKTQEITLYIDDTELKMQVGTIIEGYGTSPLIQNGRTLVPLRYIAEGIGSNVTWIPSTKSIKIVR